jgi:hypothetical protein
MARGSWEEIFGDVLPESGFEVWDFVESNVLILTGADRSTAANWFCLHELKVCEALGFERGDEVRVEAF